MMPLKTYIEGRPRISRHFRGDMRPDDATEGVYRGSAAHISSPLSVSAWEDAFSARIGKKEKSGMRYPRGELSSYAQRRGSVDVWENCRLMRRDAALSTSLRTDHSIYALRGIIRARRRQSGNASAHRLHNQGCSPGRPAAPDSSLTNDIPCHHRRSRRLSSWTQPQAE